MDRIRFRVKLAQTTRLIPGSPFFPAFGEPGTESSTVEPLLSGLLRCGHLPLPDIIKNQVVFVLFVFVKSIWAGHQVWSRAHAWRLSHYTQCYIISF